VRREGEPLLHAETVLLVGDGEAEALELDGLLDEGVRAHDDARVACRNGILRRALRAGGQAAGQQRHVEAERRSSARSERACCSARISVGAMSAAW
jgi:hypothetical protein